MKGKLTSVRYFERPEIKKKEEKSKRNLDFKRNDEAKHASPKAAPLKNTTCLWNYISESYYL